MCGVISTFIARMFLILGILYLFLWCLDAGYTREKIYMVEW